jgi:hypothetical protein
VQAHIALDRVRHHGGIGHRGFRTQDSLDLGGLDAYAVDLNLPVDPSDSAEIGRGGRLQVFDQEAFTECPPRQ